MITASTIRLELGGGDSWDLPYLAERAEANGIGDELILSRENRPLESDKGVGTLFHSYGRVYYLPPIPTT